MDNFVVPVDMRERRRARRMTQEDIAKNLHITRIHSNRIENGARPLTLDIALDLVDLFCGLTVQRAGKRYLITLDNGSPVPPDPKPRTKAYSCLSTTEKIVRLGKELSEAKERADELPRCLLSPQARREHLKRLLKEGIEADRLLDALIEEAEPDVLAEAGALSAQELAAECGPEVRSA